MPKYSSMTVNHKDLDGSKKLLVLPPSNSGSLVEDDNIAPLPIAIKITDIIEAHGAPSNASATLQLKFLAPGEQNTAGTEIGIPFNLDSTADTPVLQSGLSVVAPAGSRLSFDAEGTTTGLQRMRMTIAYVEV